jgi:hypothetical protein
MGLFLSVSLEPAKRAALNNEFGRGLGNPGAFLCNLWFLRCDLGLELGERGVAWLD